MTASTTQQSFTKRELTKFVKDLLGVPVTLKVRYAISPYGETHGYYLALYLDGYLGGNFSEKENAVYLDNCDDIASALRNAGMYVTTDIEKRSRNFNNYEMLIECDVFYCGYHDDDETPYFRLQKSNVAPELISRDGKGWGKPYKLMNRGC